MSYLLYLPSITQNFEPTSTYVWRLFHFEQLYKTTITNQRFFSDIFYSRSLSYNHVPYAWRVMLDPKASRAPNAIGVFLEAFMTADEQKNNLKNRTVKFQFTIYRLDHPLATPESKEKRWSILARPISLHETFEYSGNKSWGFKDVVPTESIWPNGDQTAQVDLMVQVTVWEQKFQVSPSGTMYDEWFDNEDFSDITFTFSQGEKIHAHRLVLSKRSEYFDKMFTGDWNEAESDTVPINEVSYEAFHALVYYLYTNKLQEGLSNETLIELYEQAHMRFIPSLAEALVNPLLKNAKNDNWDHLYSLGWRHNHAILQQAAMKYAEDRWSDALSAETVKRILEWGGIKALRKLFTAKNFGYHPDDE